MELAMFVFIIVGLLIGLPTATIGLRMARRSRRVPVIDVAQDRDLPSVSLVIATYQEARVIRRKLLNVLELEYPRDKLDVIVLDSASTDGTQQIATQFAHEHPEVRLRVLAESIRTDKASALTRFLPEFRGTIVCLSDADALLAPDSLRRAVRHFADGSVGAVTGHVGPPPSQSGYGAHEAAYRSANTIVRLGESSLGSVFIFNGPIALYRRSAIDRFYPGADDTGTAMLVARKGYKTRYEPGANAFEVTPPRFRDRLKQKTRRAVNIIDTLLSNRDLLFAKRFPDLRTVYRQNLFLHVLSPLLFPIFVASGFWVTLDITLRYPLLVTAFAGGVGILTLIPLARRGWRVLATYVEAQLILLAAMLSIARGDRKVRWDTLQDLREVTIEAPTVGPR